ncbi:protein FAR1-RELATED SEQUENCE 5-like [Aegilops tauschii subsp. strangulata]|uniref:protein FAR1-RELATED SEQUENCE 5-like n=1 Tax=Aegilops tauschii subsp. strangulata TaxID=200361 RepID=UPI003CC85915
MGHDNVAGQSSTRGAPIVVSLQSESHTLDDTGTAANVPGPTRTELGAWAVDEAVQGEEGEDEAGSQPMESYVGMRFDSLQIAKDHYNSYALRMGFSVRMNTSRQTPHTNVLVKQQFCCNKFKKAKAGDGGAEAPPVLDPIPYPKTVESDEEMEDEPPIFAEEEAGPSKKKKKQKRETIKQTQCKAKMLVKLRDGRWEVTHFVRDHSRPLVNKPSLSKYLRSHQGRMMHIMAEFYGSEMMVPFGPKELASSFDLVFQAFLEDMGGKPPDNFITDQGGAMRQSIQSIFPTTVHRCCRWHIMKKAQEKVGWLLCRNPGLSDDFNYCVDFSFTPDEFEQNWAGFFPFLQSTQRSEGFNAVSKRYVNPHNSMLNFIKQYEKIQNHILAKEGCNDYRTEHLKIELWSNFPIEKQAYKTYTRDLYRKFREEFELIGRYKSFQVGADIFELRPNQEFVAKYGSRNYLVQARVEEGSYLCECCKMDKDGILCCHILKVFTHIGCHTGEVPAKTVDTYCCT